MKYSRKFTVTEADIDHPGAKATEEQLLEWAERWDRRHEIEGVTPMWADDDEHLPMYSLPDLRYLPKTEWFVDGLIEARQQNLFFGPPGAGKTAVVSEILWSWVAGKPYWLAPQFKVSQEVPVEERKVIYILLEGIEGYYQRMEAWANVHEVDHAVMGNVKMVKDSVALWQPGQVPNRNETWNPSLRALARNIRDYGAQVVVIDTLSRATAGMDENSSEMANVVEALQEINRGYDTTFIVLHHSPKGNKQTGRGHSSLDGAMSTRILVDRSEGSSKHIRNLEVVKYRNAEEPAGKLVSYKFEPHLDGFHIAATAAVPQDKKSLEKPHLLGLTLQRMVDEGYAPSQDAARKQVKRAGYRMDAGVAVETEEEEPEVL